MPTFETTSRFDKDYALLDPSDKERFRRKVVDEFVPDLTTDNHRFRPGLRVRGVQRAPGILEMTWAPDGRATFQFGEPIADGEPPIVWRRVGTHDIFGSP